MCGSACARMLGGRAGGSSPNRMLAPTRGSSATVALSSDEGEPPMVSDAGAAGHSTRSPPRSSNINAPEESRSIRTFCNAAGSLLRSASGAFVRTGCATALERCCAGSVSGETKTTTLINSARASTILYLTRIQMAHKGRRLVLGGRSIFRCKPGHSIDAAKSDSNLNCFLEKLVRKFRLTLLQLA